MVVTTETAAAPPVDYAELVRHDQVDGRAYTDPQVFRDELDRIFTRGWVFVGHESEVPEVGDYVTRRIGLDPVIMVRTRRGAVEVLANRCAHRGVKLCQEGAGHTGSFACMFHGWTYSLSGELKGVPQPGGLHKPKGALGLDRPGQVGSHRGFVFADQSGEAGSLADHLGPGGAELLDRAASISPAGHLDISGGWIGQQVDSNWKMWAESDLDGYHLNRLHASLWRAAPGSQYEAAVLAGEDRVVSTTRDYGGGHVELEFWRGYDKPLAWLGTTPDKARDYCDALADTYGSEEADRIIWQGPPHALIFPNLFLAEMNLAIIQPLAPDLTVHFHTPLMLGGVGAALNQRILRQSEAAMGPAGFLLPDDAVAAERMQGAFGQSGGWMDVSRGLERERIDPAGHRVGHVSDETTTRGFWRQWREVMSR